MTWRCNVSAYLVVPFALAVDGHWARQTETICFDRDLAMDIAHVETQFSSGVGIYPLDQDGAYLTHSPIAWFGTFEPPSEAQAGTTISRLRAMFAERAGDGGPAPARSALQLH